MSNFTGTLGDGVTRTYADTFVYNAAGQVTSERFEPKTAMGVITPLYHTMQYNLRFQMWDNRLGTTAGGWNRGALFTYYSVSARNIGAPGADYSGNNGNVWMQEHYVPTNDAITTHTIFRDVYEYDDLNRIKRDTGVQKDTANNWTTPHQQGFTYDQWGNRTIDSAQTFGSNINNLVFGVNTANNRLNGLSYDFAGSVTTDTITGSGVREYDGENRMVKAAGVGGLSYYSYDADGKRVRRITSSVESWHVYGFDGELIAEYPVNGPASTPQKEYGYRNGQILVVAGCDVARWVVSDHLGTPRIEVDVTGSLANVRRHDYLPFGEELGVGMGNGSLRSTTNGYAADCVRQKFVDYERDSETDLDFAEARYFSSRQGRFTSPDPFLGSAEPYQPQSWNRYAYVLNNPLLYIDPTGLIWVKNNQDDKYYWINDDVWEEASKMTFNNGQQLLYTPLRPDQFEYDSEKGRVVLDPLGPTALNPLGYTVTPQMSQAGILVVGALGTSQIDSPAPGPADVVALGMLVYAGYVWMTQQTHPLPIVDPNIFTQGDRDARKINPKRYEEARKRWEQAIEELAKLLSKPNKTPADKADIERVKRAKDKARDDMKKSEPHGIKGK